MHSHSIPIDQTGRFSKLVVDYLAGGDEISTFYKYAPNLDSFNNAISEKKMHFAPDIRETLVDVLNYQYQGVKTSEAVKKNIESLKDPNTFTVTSGHQLRLFLGPLYFIYKIISAINLTEHLNTHFEKNHFVPIFWLEGEDHDFEEINNIRLFGKKVEWQSGQKGAVGRFKMDGINKSLQELEQIISTNGKGQELLNIFKEAYLGNATLESATHSIVNELFKDYGLVIFNPDNKEMKMHCRNIFSKEIFEQGIVTTIKPTLLSMAKNYKVQANPRAINLFYLSENYRELIESKGNGFITRDNKYSFTKDEMEREITEGPERFSPNVLCRPLVQEQMLPNLAYIGGGAEVAYWGELKKVFENFGIPYPVIFLRNSALYIDKNTSKSIQKLGLTISDFFDSSDAVVSKYLNNSEQGVLDLEKEKQMLLDSFQEAADKVKQYDVTLEAHVLAEGKKALKILESIEKKLMKAMKGSHVIEVEKIQKIYSKLFPDNILQERVESLLMIWDREGQAFIQYLKDNLDPFGKDLLIIEEN